MADERSRPLKRSWRGKVRQPDQSAHEWNRRRLRPVPETKSAGSRTIKIATVLTALAACVGLMIFLIFLWQRPKPAAVVLVGADYATNLMVPHNVLGWRGLKGIEAVSKAPRRWTIFNPASLQLMQGGPLTLNSPEQWTQLIAELSQTAQATDNPLRHGDARREHRHWGLSDTQRDVASGDRSPRSRDGHRVDEATAAGAEQDSRSGGSPGRGRLAIGNALQRLRPPAPGSRAEDPEREEPLGAERLRRRSTVLVVRGAGTDCVQSLCHRSPAGQGRGPRSSFDPCRVT